MGGYDELEFHSHAISPFCPTNTDGPQLSIDKRHTTKYNKLTSFSRLNIAGSKPFIMEERQEGWPRRMLKNFATFLQYWTAAAGLMI